MMEDKSNALLEMDADGCTLKELLVERRCLLRKTKGGSVDNFGLHEMDSELCDASTPFKSPSSNFVESSKSLFSFAALYIMCTTPFIPFNYVPHSCRTRWLQSSLNISRAVNAATLFLNHTCLGSMIKHIRGQSTMRQVLRNNRPLSMWVGE